MKNILLVLAIGLSASALADDISVKSNCIFVPKMVTSSNDHDYANKGMTKSDLIGDVAWYMSSRHHSFWGDGALQPTGTFGEYYNGPVPNISFVSLNPQPDPPSPIASGISEALVTTAGGISKALVTTALVGTPYHPYVWQLSGIWWLPIPVIPHYKVYKFHKKHGEKHTKYRKHDKKNEHKTEKPKYPRIINKSTIGVIKRQK